MKCSNCGSEMTPVDNHCSICGFPIIQEVTSEADSASTVLDVNNEPYHASEKMPLPTDSKEIKKPKKEKKRRAGAGLYVGMGIIAALLFIIYVLGNRTDNSGHDVAGNDSTTEGSGTAVYKSTPTKLLRVEDVIYNDAGDSLEGLYGEESYFYDFSHDKDNTAAVVVDERDMCLYVTPDLKTVPIAGGVVRAEISFDGSYIYYISLEEYEYSLYMYEVQTGKANLIDKDVTYSAILSPNGKTIAYLKYTEDYMHKNLYIAGFDNEPQLAVEGIDELMAVSDDGKTIFYKMYDEDYSSIEYVLDNGKTILLSDNKPSYFWINKDCSRIIFRDKDADYYFASGMEEPLCFEDALFYEIKYDVISREVSNYIYDGIIYDADDFEGAVFNTNDGYACIIGENSEYTTIGKNYYDAVAHRRVGNTDYYIVGDDEELLIFTIDESGNMEKKTAFSDAMVEELAVNEDASIIWFIVYKEGDYLLYQLKDEKVTMPWFNEEVESIKWDGVVQKLYFSTQDNELIAMDTEGNTELIAGDCKYLRDLYNYRGMVAYQDMRDRYHLSVFGNFIFVED